MQEAAFKRLRSQVFALYDRGAYAEALALLDGHAGAAYESDLFFWRACLHGRMGNREGAIEALRRAAERGHWYHERMLQDSDLDVIRDSAELAELQRVFQERYRRAQAEAKPERRIWDPDGTPVGLLVALHGAGGSLVTEADYWRPAASLGWRVAVLQSSQVYAPGRYHWQDSAKAMEELQHHMAALPDGSAVVLAGFSMGAGLAVRAALTGSVAALGFLAVAPSLRMEQLASLVPAAPHGLRGYLVVGTEDWAYGPAQELAAALVKAGRACRVEEHPGLAHDYPQNFTRTLERGLAFLIS